MRAPTVLTTSTGHFRAINNYWLRALSTQPSAEGSGLDFTRHEYSDPIDRNVESVSMDSEDVALFSVGR